MQFVALSRFNAPWRIAMHTCRTQLELSSVSASMWAISFPMRATYSATASTSRHVSRAFLNLAVSVCLAACRRTFGVRYVLEGGVRKSGNRVRITAQLIDAETDAHLWAEQYDRSLEDVFALQDEITMCVVGAIEPSVRKAEIDRIKRRRPETFTAYDLLLRSQQFVFAGMPAEAAKAIA